MAETGRWSFWHTHRQIPVPTDRSPLSISFPSFFVYRLGLKGFFLPPCCGTILVLSLCNIGIIIRPCQNGTKNGTNYFPGIRVLNA